MHMIRRNETVKQVLSRAFKFVLSNLADILILLVAELVGLIVCGIISVDPSGGITLLV